MRYLFYILVIIMCSCQSVHSQNFPELSVNRIKDDILNSTEEEITEDLEVLAERSISIFYLEEYALAHVRNKGGSSQGFFQQSYIIIYRWEKENWLKLSTQQFGYNIQLLNDQSGIFLSDNLFCDMTGKCLNADEGVSFGVVDQQVTFVFTSMGLTFTLSMFYICLLYTSPSPRD